MKLSNEDKNEVPNKDFVLLFKDEMVNKPVGLVKVDANGDQAVSISILPDFISASERASLLEKSHAIKNGIDLDSELNYKTNLDELKAEGDEEIDEESKTS